MIFFSWKNYVAFWLVVGFALIFLRFARHVLHIEHLRDILGNGDVGSRSSVRFWVTLVVSGARHTDPNSDPKTRIQQS